MVSTLRRRLWDADFRERHGNPASGWTRLPTGSLMVYAIHARNWTLLAATVVFVDQMARLSDRETGGTSATAAESA